MFVSQIKYKSFLNIYIHSAKKIKSNQKKKKKKKIFDHKLRGELNNLVLKVSEAPNLWYSLN